MVAYNRPIDILSEGYHIIAYVVVYWMKSNYREMSTEKCMALFRRHHGAPTAVPGGEVDA